MWRGEIDPSSTDSDVTEKIGHIVKNDGDIVIKNSSGITNLTQREITQMKNRISGAKDYDLKRHAKPLEMRFTLRQLPVFLTEKLVSISTNLISMEHVHRYAETGDILVFMGSDLATVATTLFNEGYGSHLAILQREGDELYVIESALYQHGQEDVDMHRVKSEGGPTRVRFIDKMTHYAHSGFIHWMQLSVRLRDEDFTRHGDEAPLIVRAKLTKFMNERINKMHTYYNTMSFDKNLISLTGAVFRGLDDVMRIIAPFLFDKNPNRVFCSQYITILLAGCGIIRCPYGTKIFYDDNEIEWFSLFAPTDYFYRSRDLEFYSRFELKPPLRIMQFVY